MSQLFAPFSGGAGFDRTILEFADGRATFRAYCDAVAAVARCQGGGASGGEFNAELFCGNVAKACQLHTAAFDFGVGSGVGLSCESSAGGDAVCGGHARCGGRGVGVSPGVAFVAADATVSEECGRVGLEGARFCVGVGAADAKEEAVKSAVNTSAETSGVKAGKWATSNRRKKDHQRKKRAMLASSWRTPGSEKQGFCETVLTQASPVSSCPSYGQALSDAEKEARESLARRRAAENAVAERLAKMKLASLEDEKKCQEYADLKRQRVIQWTNEATAKSQQSLEKCKSIDPSSSASQYEIRQQAKALADSEATVRMLIEVVKQECPDSWQETIEACRPCGTTEYELAEAGGGY